MLRCLTCSWKSEGHPGTQGPPQPPGRGGQRQRPLWTCPRELMMGRVDVGETEQKNRRKRRKRDEVEWKVMRAERIAEGRKGKRGKNKVWDASRKRQEMAQRLEKSDTEYDLNWKRHLQESSKEQTTFYEAEHRKWIWCDEKATKPEVKMWTNRWEGWLQRELEKGTGRKEGIKQRGKFWGGDRVCVAIGMREGEWGLAGVLFWRYILGGLSNCNKIVQK